MRVSLPDKGITVEFPDEMDKRLAEVQIAKQFYGVEPDKSWSTDSMAYEAPPAESKVIQPQPGSLKSFMQPDMPDTLMPSHAQNYPLKPSHEEPLTPAGQQSLDMLDRAKQIGPEQRDKTALSYAPFIAVKALKGAMTPVLGPLKTMGMDTESILNTASEYWQKQLPDVKMPNVGIVKDEQGDWDIQRIDDIPVADLVGATSELTGFMAPASAALKGGGLVAEKLSAHARPFYRNILKGMIGGALLGEGKKDETLEMMAMFGAFEGAGYALGKIPGAIKRIKDSNAYRKATIKERGLVVQNLEQTLKQNPNISEAELAKMSDDYFRQAMAKRSTGESPAGPAPAPQAPTPKGPTPRPPAPQAAAPQTPASMEAAPTPEIIKAIVANPKSDIPNIAMPILQARGVTAQQVNDMIQQQMAAPEQARQLPAPAVEQAPQIPATLPTTPLPVDASMNQPAPPIEVQAPSGATQAQKEFDERVAKINAESKKRKADQEILAEKDRNYSTFFQSSDAEYRPAIEAWLSGTGPKPERVISESPIKTNDRRNTFTKTRLDKAQSLADKRQTHVALVEIFNKDEIPLGAFYMELPSSYSAGDIMEKTTLEGYLQQEYGYGNYNIKIAEPKTKTPPQKDTEQQTPGASADGVKQPWEMTAAENEKNITRPTVINKGEPRNDYLYTEDTPENIEGILSGKANHPRNLVYFQRGGLHHNHFDKAKLVLDLSKIDQAKIKRERQGQGEYLLDAKDIKDAVVGVYKNNFDLTTNGHKDIVKQALADNKPVPQSVLKDYPDLSAPAASDTSATAGGVSNRLQSILKLSADTPAQLRPVDVDRVMDAAAEQGLVAEFKNWWAKQGETNPRTDEAVKKWEPEAMDPDMKVTDDTVKVDIPEAKAEALKPKEQKKYLMDEIEAAIAAAPVEYVNLDTTARKKLPDETAKAFEENKRRTGTITIEVPGDGEFTVINTKSALRQFQKKAKSFPAAIMTNKKVITTKSTKKTGARTVDFAGEYITEYTPRKAPDHLETKAAYYDDGWYSDGTYIIKSAKPKTKKTITPVPGSGIKPLVEVKDKDLYPATLGAEHYTNPTGDKGGGTLMLDVYSESMPTGKDKDGNQFLPEVAIDPRIVDVVLKKYPKAEPYLHKNGLLYFKHNEDVVAAVIRMRTEAGGVSDAAKARRPEGVRPKESPVREREKTAPDSKTVYGILNKAYPYKGISTASQEKQYISKIKKELAGIVKGWQVDMAIKDIKADRRGPKIYYVTPIEILQKLEKAGDVRRPGAPSTLASKSKPEKPADPSPLSNFKPIPEGMRRSKIIKDLSKKLRVPIRVGKFRQKALGIYKVGPQVIRTAKANDFPTIIHEIGHHIQELLGFPVKMPAEVRQMAYEGAKDIDREGFAEFLRYYITKPEKLKAEAPEFFKEFGDRLDRFPDVKNIMTKAKESWEMFQASSSVAKVHSFITAGKKRSKLPTFDEIYAEVKDNLHPIRRAVEAAKAKGADITDRNDPYVKARLARGWARKAEQFLRYQPFRYVNGEPVFQGKSLRDILKPVEEAGERQLLDTYLVAKRAINDQRILKGFQDVLSRGDFEQTVKDLEPRFEKVAKELYEYNDILLDYLVDSGRISTDLAAEIRAKNLFYTPLYRLMDGGTSNLGQKAGSVFNPIKKLKGSSRDIISPTENILKNTYAIINSAERTRVGTALLDLSKVEGMGSIIERIPWPMKPEKIRKDDFLKLLSQYGEFQKVIDIKKSEETLTSSLNNVKEKASSKMEAVAIEALKTRGWSEAEAKQVISRIKASQNASEVIEKTVEKTTIMTVKEELGFSNMPDTVIATFRPDTQRVGKNEAVFYQNGKPVLVELDPWLHKAVSNIEAGDINMFIQLASYPAKWLRAGATTFSPEFGIRNPMRDQMVAFIQSKYGFVPGVDFMRGLMHMVGKTKLWQEFNASGAAHSTVVSIDRDYLTKNLKDLLGSDVRSFGRNPLKFMQAVSEYTEEASRVGEYARAKKKGVAPETAGMAGREVSLDFGRQGGNAARSANMISAFWNARVEGLDKMRRSFKERPLATTLKAFLGVTVPSLILWITQKDDPHYQELPAWRKTLFWNIAVDGFDDEFDFFVPIPKPFEWGLLFGSLPIAMLDWMYTKDPTQAQETAKQIGKTLDLVPVPTGAIPIVEWWANRSYFFDSPLVPRDKEGLEPYLQYKGRTSETMKLAAKMVKDIPGLKEIASPAKLDNLLMGYTAGAGRMALEGTDWLLETFGAVKTPPDPKMTLNDIPGARAFAVRFPTSSSRSVERFYKDYLKEKRAWESKKEVVGVRGKGVSGLNKLNPKLARMEKVAKTLSVLRKMVSETYESEMSPEKKTETLNTLYYSMINLARTYYKQKPIEKVKQ